MAKGPVLNRMTPEGRKARQAQARRLAREAAAAEARRLASVRQQMQAAERRSSTSEEIATSNRIVKGLSSTLRLVASSYAQWNPRVRFDVELDRHGRDLSGWTDFRRIYVRYPGDRFHVEIDGSVTSEVTRTSIREVLGIGYHEVGHCLFSVPFTELPKPDDDSIVWGSNYQVAWNALEDQRMELAVTDASPEIARYFTAMYLQNFLKSNLHDAWWLAVGRLYLPDPVRNDLRDLFIESYGPEVEDVLRSTVRGYTTATSLSEMVRYIILYKDLWDHAHPSGDQQHTASGEHRWSDRTRKTSERASDETVSETAASDDRWDDAEKAENSSKADEDGAAGGSEDAETEGGDDGGGAQSQTGEDGDEDGVGGVDLGESASSSGRSSASGEGARERIEAAAKDAADEANASEAVDRAIAEIAQTDAPDYLPYASSTALLDPEDADRGFEVSKDMERALEVANAYNSPTWRRRQEQGAVDALAYRTRRPGDTDFRRLRTGDGSKGFDVAVSLVLDVSGSMAPRIDELSVAALSIKEACWNLGIPCTVTTFDSVAELIFDAEDEPSPVRLTAKGGTYPAEALTHVPSQRHDRTDHLVLLMTDGECSNGASEVAGIIATGAHVLGVGLGSEWATVRLAEELKVYDTVGISTCAELAVLVEEWLARTVSVSR